MKNPRKGTVVLTVDDETGATVYADPAGGWKVTAWSGSARGRLDGCKSKKKAMLWAEQWLRERAPSTKAGA